MRGYDIGTIVRSRTGYHRIKVGERNWKPLGRHLWESKIEPLTKHHRVYHKNGNRQHDELDNLVAIRFNATTYRLLPRSEVVYAPRKGAKVSLDSVVRELSTT